MAEAQQSFAFTHARRRDPQTSIDAAEAASRFASSQAGRVLRALKTIGPAGKTRIAAACGLDHIAVARRTADLQRAGLAIPLDSTEPSSAGKAERLWRAV